MYLILALALVGLTACSSDARTVPLDFKLPDGSSSPRIVAEICNTPREREQGMMYRREAPEDKGMLFVFPDEMPRSFWMKNTFVSLDIIYIGANKEVVSISERALPLTETSRPSTGPAMYVLEIAGGLSSKIGIKPGAKLQLYGDLPAASQ